MNVTRPRCSFGLSVSYTLAKHGDPVYWIRLSMGYTQCNGPHAHGLHGFACASRNQLMRALDGNTAESHDQFRISTFNTNGLTAHGRWQQLLDRDFDLCMITETHCTHYHQRSLAYDHGEFTVIWGAPCA